MATTDAMEIIPWWKKKRDKDKAAKEAIAGSEGGGAASAIKAASTITKSGKSKKHKGKDSKYNALPDDISLPNKFGGETFSGKGHNPATSAPEFPKWACSEDRIQKESRIIRPTDTNLLDIDGKPIHAHGGGFLAPHQGGGSNKRWWWYGETSKGNPKGAGVNAYSSSDLLHWKHEGLMINQKTLVGKLRQLKSSSAFDVIRNNQSAVVIVERPKVIYCPKTSKYVMWFHLDHKQTKKPHYHWRLVAVATSDHPNGPFHLHHAFHPAGLPSLDVSLYQLPADDTNGNKAHEAFLIRAIDNKYIGSSKLREDFLDVESTDVTILTAGRREAPVVFRSNGIYRLLVTETDGWTPTALHLLNGTKGLSGGEASKAGNRKNGVINGKVATFSEARSPTPPNVKSSYDSQVTSIIQHCDGLGRPYYIYVGDRWNVGPGKKGIEHAGYVMLPLSTPNNKPVSLQWRSAWDLYDPWNLNVK